MYYDYDDTSVTKIRRKENVYLLFLCASLISFICCEEKKRDLDMRIKGNDPNAMQMQARLTILNLQSCSWHKGSHWWCLLYQFPIPTKTKDISRTRKISAVRGHPAKLSKPFQKAYSKGKNQQETRIILLLKRLERSYIYSHSFRRTN